MTMRALTVRLRIAHLDLEEALRHTVHLLDLPQTQAIVRRFCPSQPPRTQRAQTTYGLLAPAEAGLVKDAAARKGRHGRHLSVLAL